MRVLVLGGSYFVGRHVALAFRERGHEVVLLNRGTRPMALPVLAADRNDGLAMRSVLSGLHFDTVIDTSGTDPGQAFLAAQALGGRYQRWIFVSTAAVYDDTVPRPLREEHFAEGALSWGDYGVKKAKTEALLREICGHKLTVVRPGYVYGPYNSLARETFIWSRLLRARPLFVPGDGSTRASFVHVRDLAEIIIALASSDAARGLSYNVAHPEWVSFDGFVHAAAAAAGVRARIVHVPRGTLSLSARDYFPFRDQELTLDVSRLLEHAGMSPCIDLREGLRQTFEAYTRESLRDIARESSVDLELSLALQVSGAQ